MKAGTYYIGDLCYVMHNEWSEVCNITLTEDDSHEGEFQLSDGREFAMYRTTYGDGTYMSNHGNALDVDSGTIGAILVEDITDDLSLDDLRDYGAVVTFTEDFNTDVDNGLISFGDFTVQTNDDDDEDYYDDDEDYYDDEEVH